MEANQTASSLKSRPGRKSSDATLILRNFYTKNEKHPRLEYIRASLIRFEKKIIRYALRRRKLDSILGKKIPPCPDLVVAAQKLVSSHRARLMDSLGAWATNCDPASSSIHKSFTKSFAKEFYNLPITSKLHDLLINAVFESESMKDILEFFDIRYDSEKDEGVMRLMLSNLKALLLSSKYSFRNAAEESTEE